ncbi:hypothetical protein [Halomonas sp. ANAO-440]|nr:hypothetical protein [Halomonas sp. ANAO-440]
MTITLITTMLLQTETNGIRPMSNDDTRHNITDRDEGQGSCGKV